MQKVETFVVFHFQDMGVPAYEKFWRAAENLFAYAWVVFPGIAAYMFHEHFGTFAVPAQLFGEKPPQVSAVAIAVNGTQWFDFGKAFGYFHGTYVAGVPDFIAARKVFAVFFVPIAVCVRKQPYPFHAG